MQPRIKTYLDDVCAQIRWKRARGVVSSELENHISDQAEAYAADGMEEDAALEKAVCEMGDPVTVGQQMDRLHRPKPDWVMLAMVGVLVALGLFLQYIALPDILFYKGISRAYITQIIVGFSALMILYYTDFSIIGKYPKMIFVALAVVAYAVTDAKIPYYSHNTYYLALLMIPAFAGIVYNNRKSGYLGILKCGMFYMLGAIGCLLNPVFSALVLYSASCLLILTAAIAKGWFRVKKAGAFAAVYFPTGVAILTAFIRYPYLSRRIEMMFNPGSDPLNDGYWSLAVREVLANARLWGEAAVTSPTPHSKGLVSYWNTDFIIAYVFNKFGIIAGIAMIALLILLLAWMFVRVFKQKSALGFIISFSCTLAICVQCLNYVLSNLGYVFMSATLPLISYGGKNLVANMMLFGVFLSVGRNGSIVRDRVLQNRKPGKWLSRFGRKVELAGGRVVIDLRTERE